MIAVTGMGSTIIKELSAYDEIIRINKAIPDVDLFVLAAGVMKGLQWLEQNHEDIIETFLVNTFTPVTLCEQIFTLRPHARVCIVGSASGFNGSYDMAYAMSKSAIHTYVETRPIDEKQRLFAVAPGIIKDSNMAKKRHDYAEILKGDYITSKEVAKWIMGGLVEGTTGEVIRL